MLHSKRKQLKLCAILLAVVAIAAIMHSMPLGTFAPLQIELRNNLHSPVFAILTTILLISFRRDSSLPIAVAISASIALAAGILGELAQYFTHGQASIDDLKQDCIGICLGLCVGYVVSDRSNLKRSRRVKTVLSIAALVGIVEVFSPLASSAWALTRQYIAFPTILTFDSQWEHKTYTMLRGATVEPGPAPASWGNAQGNIAHIRFSDIRFSGIEIHPFADWSDFDVLSITAASGSDEPFELMLRISDEKHGGHYVDRFRRKLYLTPEKQEFRIRVSEIQSAPAGRDMEVDRIRSVILFIDDPVGREIAILGDIQLERELN